MLSEIVAIVFLWSDLMPNQLFVLSIQAMQFELRSVLSVVIYVVILCC